MQYRYIPHLVSSILLLTILLVTGLLYKSSKDGHSEHYQAEVSNQLFLKTAHLESELNNKLSLLNGLVAFAVSNSKNLNQSLFENYAKALLRTQPGVRSIQLAPAGIIKYVYPSYTNQAVLGLNILSSGVAKLSSSNQQLMVSGPKKLRQGGNGFIAHQPIYLTDSKTKMDSLWGYATIIIDVMPILSGSGLYGNHQNLLFALRSFDLETEKYQVFFGASSVFKVNSLTHKLNIPSLSVELGVYPQGGWEEGHGQNKLLLAGGLVLAFVVPYFAFLILRSPIFLREQLQISSSKLEKKSNELKFERRLQDSLFNNIPDLIYYKDDKDRYVLCNHAFANYYGKEIHEIIGQTDEELDNEGMGGYFHYINAELGRQHKQQRDEEWVEKSDGESLFLDSLKIACFNQNNRLDGFLGVSRDCTEQQLTKDALQFSEHKYSNLIKTLNEVICEIEMPSGKIKHISSAAEKIFDLNTQQMSNIDFILSYATEASKQLLNNIHTKHLRNTVTPLFEYDVIVGDKVKTLRHRERGVFNKQGKLIKIEAICNDVTEEKRYEAVLRVMAEGMSAKIGNELYVSVVEYLNSLLKTEHAFIAKIDRKNNRATSIAHFKNDHLADNFSYSLDQTPFDKTIEDGSCFCDNVSDCFPGNQLLKDLQVKSYLGSTLYDNKQEAIGVLVVLSQKDIEQSNHVLAILELFSIRLSAELQRQEHEAHLRKLSRAVEQSPLTVVITDTNGLVEYGNPSFYNSCGYTETEVLGHKTNIIKSGRQNKAFYEQLWQTILSGHDWHGQMWNKRKSGEEYLESVSIFPVRGEDQEVQNFVSIKEDLTEFHATQKHLKLSDAVFNATTEAIIITDKDNKIISTNPAFSQVTGYSAAEALGQDPAILSSGYHDGEFYQQMNETLEQEGKWEGEIWNRRKNGELYPEWLSIVAIRDEDVEPGKASDEPAENPIQQYIALFSDITKGKEQDQLIYRQANYDALTGLPNRTLFYSHLSEALKAGQKHTYSIVLLFIDLDRFKLINDTLGHGIGDKLLQKASNRIEALLPDATSIARLGDDDFAVILNEGLSLEQIAATANSILEELNRPYLIDKEQCYVSASIGIAIYPGDINAEQDLSKSAMELVTHAESAMFSAKNDGGNHFHFYTPEMNKQLLLHHQLQNDLYQAISNQEFETYYQPIYNIKEKRITGAEALIRWNHPVKGLISPNDFIPYAEQSGQIIAIGVWILKDVCQQIKAWELAGQEPLRISINLSPLQYLDSDSIEEILNIIVESQINTQHIIFEITENINMEENQKLIDTLKRIRDLGIKLSMDDFGTGYSSLSYLRRLPISILKIDRSFIKELGTECDSTLVKAIIAMAKSFELEVVAEGVEQVEQLEQVSRLGSDYIQGYHYSKPLPKQAFEAYLKSFNPNKVTAVAL